MKVISLMDSDGQLAICEAKGVRRQVSMLLLQGQGIQVNDFVMVGDDTISNTAGVYECDEFVLCLKTSFSTD